MKKLLLFLIVAWVFSFGVVAHAQHFTPVAPSGLTYDVEILDATIEAGLVEVGDEIGVFDGALCVGAGVVIDPSFSSSLVITTQLFNGVGNDGAIVGNAINFKIYDINQNLEYSVVTTAFGGDGTFGNGASEQALIDADNQVPVAGLLVDPADAALVSSTDYRFEWDHFTDPEGGIVTYTLQLTISGAYDEGWDYDCGTSIRYDVTGLQNNELYAWRVVGTDSHSETTTSAEFVFDVNLPTTAFSLTSPADEAYIPGNSVRLEWDASTDPEGNVVSYSVEVTETGDFADATTYSAGTSTRRDLAGLNNFSTYTWRVIAADGSGNTTTSTEEWTFTPYTSVFSPVAETGNPYSIFITDAYLGAQLEQGDEIAVYDGTLCVGAGYIGPNGFTSPVPVTAWERDVANSLDGFTSGNPILYKIYDSSEDQIVDATAAGYAFGNGNFGVDPFTSVTQLDGNQPLGSFDLVEPTNGQTGLGLSQRFEWSQSNDPESQSITYTVQLTSTGDFADAVDYVAGTSERRDITGLSNYTTYTWRVLATTAAGDERYSTSTFTFTTGESHFAPVAETGRPYSVFVQDADLNGSTLAFGDEIAVFDGDLCVGSAFVPATGFASTLAITAWEQDVANSLPGFADGNTISFVIYDASGDVEVVGVPTYSNGDGTFGYDPFTVVTGLTSTLPPTAFDLDSPADAAIGQATSLRLEWFASTDPEAGSVDYTVELTSTGNFADAVDYPAGSSIRRDITNLTNYTTYSWRVRAEDSTGNVTYSSQTRTFTTGNSYFTPVAETGRPYSIFVQDADLNGTTLEFGDEIAVFDGDLCVGVGHVPATVFASPVAVTAWEADVANSLDGFTDGNTISFKVYDASASVEMGSVPTFSTGDGTFGFDPFTVVSGLTSSLPPVAFDLSAPSNGATGQPASLRLEWLASSDPEGGSVLYTVQVTSTGNFADATDYPAGSSIRRDITGLANYTEYTWRVFAEDATNGLTYSSQSWTFTTGEGHFTPVAETGRPYSLFVQDAEINGVTLDFGDEIAIFDGVLCVGSGFVPASGFASPIAITAWEEDVANSLDGFSDGNAISFQVYDASTDLTVSGFPTYSNGDGTFGYDPFTVVSGMDSYSFDLSAPADASADQETSIRFEWNAPSAASFDYTVQLTSTGDFADAVDYPAGSSIRRDISGLNNYTTYTWRVKAEDASSNVFYSRQSWTLTTGQSYFTPVVETGRPYSIFVQDADFNGTTLELGDEIAVFDGDLCVGSAFVPAAGFASPLAITAWEADVANSLAGFTSGNTISFKVFDASASVEMGGLPTYTTGDGTFGYDPFTVVSSLTSSLPPVAFDLSSPADGAENQSTSLRLEWNASSDPEAASVFYVVELTSTGNFDDAVEFPAGSGIRRDVTGLTNYTEYTWRVRAYDATNSVTYSTQTWTFTTGDSHFSPVAETGRPYSIFVQDADLNGTTLEFGDEIAVFDGDLCVGVANVPATVFASPVAITAWEEDIANSLAGFTPGNTIYFQIYDASAGLFLSGTPTITTGDGSFGYDPFTIVSALTTTLPPAVFDLSSPADGATGQSSSLRLEWNASSDPEGGSVNYTVQITSTGDFADATEYDAGSSIRRDITGLNNYTDYTWRVKATDASNNVTYSTQTWTFSTGESHFTPVAETGRPYSIFVQDADIAGANLEHGDEISVFDGDLCVGVANVPAAGWSGTLAITAWEKDDANSLAGFSDGNTMSFRIFDASAGTEMVATPSYGTGDGTFGFDPFTVLSNITCSQPATAFSLGAPANGSTGLGTTVRFEWNASTDPEGGALTYTVQLTSTGDFADAVEYAAGTSIRRDISGLSNYTTYTWRVFAEDVTGNITYSTETWTATTGATHFTPVAATGRPYSIFVQDAEVSSVTLEHGDEIAVFDGELCVGFGFVPETGFASPIAITAWEADVANSLDGFIDGNTMSFRVYDASAGTEMVATATITTGDGTFGYDPFTIVSSLVGNLPPAAFSLDTPADGSTLTSSTITFEWNLTTDPEAQGVVYDVEITSTGDFADAVTYAAGTSQRRDITDLANYGSFMWRVIAMDPAGNKTYSTETWSFDTRVSAFSVVPETGRPYPVILTAEFEGNGLEVGDEIALFDGALCVGSAFVTSDLAAPGLSITAWEADVANSLAGFTAGNAIVAQVHDLSEGTTFDVIENFTSGGNFGDAPFSVGSLDLPPTAFALTSPENNTTLTLDSQRFEWETSNDPESGVITYSVELTTTGDFADAVNYDAGTSARRDITGLSNFSSYAWRVKATDSNNQNTYSRANFQFNTNFQHFTPVAETGRPYSVFITNATIAGAVLDFGDEVAVFDGDLCVGSANIPADQFTSPVVITAWEQDVANNLAGFVDGNNITFKIYDASAGYELAGTAAYTSGDGSFGFDPFTAASLTTSLPPAAFSLVAPTDASVVTSSTQQVQWGATTDPEGSLSGYEVEVTSTGNFADATTYPVGITTRFDLTNLLNSTTYTWRVAAVDADNNRTNSTETWTFDTEIQYFTPVPETGRPYTIIVTAAQLDGADFNPGDEIGVFDGFLCVGTAVIPAEGIGTGVPITAWEEDTANSLAGFTDGNTMTFRAFSYGTTTEYSAVPTYTSGDGTFGFDPFTTVTLASVSATHFTPLAETGLPYSVFVQAAEIDGSSLNFGDEIGVYDGTTCVGSAIVEADGFTNPISITTWEEDVANSLAGFTDGNTISFKIYDASADSEVDGTASYSTGDGSFGFDPFTVVSNLTSAGGATITTSLAQNRFELVSFNVTPADPAASTVFGGLTGLEIALANSGSVYIPGPPPINTILNVDLTQGYRVFVTSAQDLVTSGAPLSIATEYSITANRFNWISYPFQDGRAITDVLSDIFGDVLIIQDDDGNVYIPGATPINTIGNMVPGNGYQVFATTTRTFTYGTGGGSSPASVIEVLEIPEIAGAPEPTGLPYTVIVNLDDELRSQNPAVIEVYDRKTLVGKAPVLPGKEFAIVTAWQGSPEHNLIGFAPGNGIAVSIKDVSGNIIDTETTNRKDLEFGKGAYATANVEFVALPTQFAVHNAYPNPFNPTFSVPFDLPENGMVRFAMFNILGQQVLSMEQHFDAGYHNIHFGATQKMTSGVYFLQVNFNGKREIQRVVMLK